MERIWMKHWPPSMPKELSFPQGKIPVFEYLRINAKNNPDKPAIIYYGREISYRELDESSDRFANYLLGLGLSKGDRVGLFLPNSPQYIIAHYGVQKMGGIVCPCNSLFKELELRYEINDAGMKVLVAMDYLMPIVLNVLQDVPTIKRVVVAHFSDYLPEEPTVPVLDYMKAKFGPFEQADEFLEVIKNSPSEPPKVDIDVFKDIALFEYTGGTTGLPKGAMLTHYAHLFKATVAATISELSSDSRVLTTMPYFNIAGMLFILAPVVMGATNILITQFEPLAILEAVHKHKATFWYSAVPMNLAVMSHPKAKEYDLSSLRLNLCTSFVVALNEQIAKQWKEFTGGCELLEGAYGLSETHTADTFCPKHRIKYGSMGIPTFETDMKIVDFNDRTREMPLGEEGEIAVKNPGCMVGYWNKPEETANTLIDGWVYTGDVGKFDEDGYLYWLGRRKEMIKVSGFSVFPEEVESLINHHPAVLENAVIPVPDEKKGEVVKSFVVLKPEYKGKVSAEEIIEWAKNNMTPHKVPAYIEFRDELPKQGVKLLRRVLREEEAKKREGK